MMIPLAFTRMALLPPPVSSSGALQLLIPTSIEGRRRRSYGLALQERSTGMLGTS